MTAFVGTGQLLRLALRRDRIMIPAWVVGFAVVAAASASASIELYPSAESRVAAAETVNNTPSLVALYGLIYDVTSLGAVSMVKLGGTGSALVAVLAIVLMIRHTRAEEEAGRLELLGGTVMGRHAPLAAAFIVTIGTHLLLGALTAAGLIAAGLPAAGSLAFGLAWTSIGVAFAAIAAVAAQVTVSGRAAIGLAVAALGVTYLLRAVGDTAGAEGPTWLRWLSPIGWAQQTRPFAGDRWWVLLVPVAAFVVIGAIAHTLNERRDSGSGLLPDRLGRAHAGPTLTGPMGLAWRLHRGALLGWLAGFAVLGLVFGNIASSVGNLLDSPAARDMIAKLGGESALTDAFLAAELGIVAVVTSVYGIQVVLRLRSEEADLRAEPVLTTGVSRQRWSMSHLGMALVGTTALMACAGAGAGIAHAAQTGDAGQVGRVFVAAVVQLPAVWVLIGIAAAVFGIVPRLVVIGWIALVVFLLVGELGPIFELDPAIMELSPYAHTPRLPGGELTAAPLLWLVGITAVLIILGILGLRRRDLPIT